MRDVHHLRELILGFAIMTPIACQSVPAREGPVETTAPQVTPDMGQARVLDTSPTPDVSPSPPPNTSIPTPSPTRAQRQAGVQFTRSSVSVAIRRGQSTLHRCKTFPEIYAIQKAAYKAQYSAWKQKHQDFGGSRIPKPARLKKLKTCPAYYPTYFNAAGCGGVSPSPLIESVVTKAGTICCYTEPVENPMPCGRRYLVEERATTARLHATTAWMGRPACQPEGASPVLRTLAGQAWLEDALEEHASIAAFSRATLELMRLGAPADLLAEYQSASLDEIRHARMCFSLASALLGRDVSAGALEVEGPREDLDEIIADVFWGGCVGESVAALGAQRALGACTWEPARRALEEIAEDEARHAATAWSTLSFLGQHAPERVRRVLENAQPLELPHMPAQTSALAPLGRLNPDQQARAAQDAWTHLIAPMVAQLLDEPGSA